VIKIPDLRIGVPITDANGSPTPDFARKFVDTLQSLAGTINKISRINSHTNPTTILTATDNGSTATVTIISHTRVYGDGSTLSVASGTISGLVSNTNYAFYYDDKSLANPNPTYIATTTISMAQAVAADGRHFLGVIVTPAAGSGKTRNGGGVYPAGSSVGGEI
jgi:hypothetical protein